MAALHGKEQPFQLRDGTLVIRIVHIHIGKTSGTSFAKSLNGALGPETCSPPFVQTRMTAAEAEAHGKYPIVHGHISRDDQRRWFRERNVMTILREPIDRCLSFLHYVRSLDPASSQVAHDAAHLDIGSLIETYGVRQNIDNTMVRQLGGHILDLDGDLEQLLEAAKETLREAIWVGFHDRIDTDLQRLGACLGADIQPAWENITPNRCAISEEDSALIADLTARNEYDRALFDWANQSLR